MVKLEIISILTKYDFVEGGIPKYCYKGRLNKVDLVEAVQSARELKMCQTGKLVSHASKSNVNTKTGSVELEKTSFDELRGSCCFPNQFVEW